MTWVIVFAVLQLMIDWHIYSCLSNHVTAVNQDRFRITSIETWIGRGITNGRFTDNGNDQ